MAGRLARGAWFALGWVAVGIGTIAFTFGIGPLVHIFLPKLTLPPRNSAAAASSSVELSTAEPQ